MSAGRLAVAAAAGLAWAVAAPPYGWWPLLPVGVAALTLAVRSRPVRSRLGLGALTGVVLYATTLRWLTGFSAVGYVVVVLLETALLAGAVGLTGVRRRGAGPGAAEPWWTLPAALVLLEAVQTRFPLGGFPLPALSLTQLDAPWAAAAPLGGSLLLTASAAAVGSGLAAVVVLRGARRRLTALAVGTAVGAVPALVGAQLRTSAAGTLDVAVVQGGGPRGTRAVFSDADEVTRRHLRVADGLTAPGPDLVLLPEGVVDPEGPMAGSAAEPAFTALARRLGSTVVVGVVEAERDRFRNAALAYGPDGRLRARYDKEHRVPFGEYIPARRLFERLSDATSLVPRDAVVGRGRAVLPSASGPLGVVISFEVFFADRVREAVGDGGQVVLVPTNASSYAGPEVPATELAAARMRAREFGRAVLQSAPTGYSAVVLPDGQVVRRSELGDPALLRAVVPLRTGLTPYARVGDRPVLVAAALLLLLPGRRRAPAPLAGSAAGPVRLRAARSSRAHPAARG